MFHKVAAKKHIFNGLVTAYRSIISTYNITHMVKKKTHIFVTKLVYLIN